jgi:hypothetical protein
MGIAVISAVFMFALPGMSQLNDMVIVIYLLANTKIAYVFLKGS